MDHTFEFVFIEEIKLPIYFTLINYKIKNRKVLYHSSFPSSSTIHENDIQIFMDPKFYLNKILHQDYVG